MNLVTKMAIEQHTIQQMVNLIASNIVDDYSARPKWIKSKHNVDGCPLLVGVLKGAAMFTMDLVKAISSMGLSFDYDFICVESYCKTESGSIELCMDINDNIICGRDIILVDDIYDTGNTLQWLINHVKSKGAKSVKTCVLLNKACDKQHELYIDYPGFMIENNFVVGYGMDFVGTCRRFPYIVEIEVNNEDSSV